MSDSVISEFRAKIESTVNSASRRSLEQTVDAFRRFLGDISISFSDFSEDLLGEWVSWLFSRGYSIKTITYYINRLSSLYGKSAKDGIAEDRGAFARTKAKLANASTGGLEIASDPECFSKLRSLVTKDCSKTPLRQLAKDITLFSIFNGGLSFDELAKYRKDDYKGDDEAILKIVNRYSKLKNKYLFPLNQSERTPRQLNAAVSSLFYDALKTAGISLSAYSVSAPADLWTAVAMHCGIPASEISTCIGPAGHDNPILSFAPAKDMPQEQIDETRRRVTQILAEDPEHWYAMQFRPHISYEMIQERLNAAGITLKQTFYPMEEIVRQIGKRLKRESRPVMPGLLFFRSKATELPDLFYRIGDLAWGYRYTRDRHSPYATIPNEAIDTYAIAVGKFTDGMDQYPDGTIGIEPGDTVEITGGEFKGCTATFEKEMQDIAQGTKRITYRLKLSGLNSITWTVNLDPRLTAKLP